MAAAIPSPAKLRQLILKFYSENDPARLQMGLDVSGIVEWTMRNGMDALNNMLYKQFKKKIDVSENQQTARDNLNQMRISLNPTMSTKLQKVEHQYRMKLATYFSEKDPSMVKADKEDQFEKFVKYAMLNGMDKLNEKLVQKYGVGVDGKGLSTKPVEDGEDEAIQAGDGGNPFGLDVARLKSDLKQFYEEMEDLEQVEVLDDITDWACQIGVDEFNNKIEQMYGTSLNAFLRDMGKPVHVNGKPAAKGPKPEPVKAQKTQPPPQPKIVEVQNRKNSEEEEDDNEGDKMSTKSDEASDDGEGRPFENMTDDEIKAELRAFYEVHDPDNLEKLDDVCKLCRKLGRTELNKKLMDIYGEKIQPIVVKKKVEIAPPPPEKLSEVKMKPPGLGFKTGLSTKITAVQMQQIKDDAKRITAPKAIAPPPKPPVQIDIKEEQPPPVPPRMSGRSEKSSSSTVESSDEEEGFSTKEEPINKAPTPILDRLEEDVDDGDAEESVRETNERKESAVINTPVKVVNNVRSSNLSADSGFDFADSDEVENKVFAEEPPPPPQREAKKSEGLVSHRVAEEVTAIPEKKMSIPAVETLPPKATAPSMDLVVEHKPDLEGSLAKERDYWKDMQKNKASGESEFQRMAREKRERNQDGKSRVRGDDGQIIEINILLKACNKYRLDILAGICECGFTKADHAAGSKYKVNAWLDGNGDKARNENGLFKVKALAQNLGASKGSDKNLSNKKKPLVTGSSTTKVVEWKKTGR